MENIIENNDNAVDVVCLFVNSILEKLGLDCTASATLDKDFISVNITGPSSDVITARRGEILDSLQYLSIIILNKTGNNNLKLFMDCDNFRSKRELTLKKLANRIARDVAVSKKPFSLEPMNPFERRIIHLALQDDEYVYTTSEGDEPNRYVCVIPKNITVEAYDGSKKIDFKKNGFGRKKSFSNKKRSFF